MADFTYRYPPVSLYDIGRYEHWLGDMAAKGLFFTGVNRWGFARFQKGEPEKRRYRLEPAYDDLGQPLLREQELYAAMGWTYIASVRQLFHVFAAPDRADVPELHTEPEVDAEIYKRACERVKRNFGRIVRVFLVIFLLDMLMIFRIPDDPVWETLLTESGYFLTLSFFNLVQVGIVANSAVRLYRLERRLAAGEPIDHNAPYRAAAVVHHIWKGALLLMVFLVAAVPIHSMMQMRCEDYFAVKTPLPAPVLTEIDTDFVYRETGWNAGRPSGNYVESAWSFFAPEQLVIGQSGSVHGREVSMEVRCFRMRMAFLAPVLYESYADACMETDLDKRASMRPLTGSERAGFDEAALIASDWRQVLIARRGKWVIMADYWGREPLEEHTAAFADAVKTVE